MVHLRIRIIQWGDEESVTAGACVNKISRLLLEMSILGSLPDVNYLLAGKSQGALLPLEPVPGCVIESEEWLDYWEKHHN